MTAERIDQDQLSAAVASMPAGNLSSLRTRAASFFVTDGFPTTRHEDWKYTNLSAAQNLSRDWLANYPPDAASSSVAAEDDIIEQIDAVWIRVRNGAINLDPSITLPAGVSITRLSDNAELPEIAVDTPLSALNAALLADGIRIRVASNIVVEKPLGILLTDDPAQRVAQTRLIVELEENSKLQIVEYAVSAADGEQFTNSVNQINIDSGARLDHVRIQNRSNDHLSTNRVIANLAETSLYNHHTFDIGGGLTRNDVVIGIDGSGANVNLQGLYLATGQQHIDNHTRVEHRVGPAESNERYRGILSGKARGVFNGQAIVFVGADGTDANQENHNLLLSTEAEINTKPELEIYADDVKCSHGATVGQVDESALFYLRSRGLDTDEARKLLTKAFAADVLDELAIDEVRDVLQSLVDQKLAHMLDDRHS